MPQREYLITDGLKFVKQDVSGKYNLVNSSTIADVWTSSKIAEAVLQNAIPKAIKQKCYIAYFDNNKLVKYSLSNEEKQERRERIVQNEHDKGFVLEQYSFDNDNNIQSLILGLENIKDVFKTADKRYRKLEDELCRLDFIDEDLKHYLIRKKVNASNGYKITSIRQKIAIKRVSVKNQMKIVEKFKKHNSTTIKQIEDICDTVEALRGQTYKPRVLIDLFENDCLDIVI